MKKIAVFCALPPDRNTGMATVDLAAFSVIKRIVPEAEITLYVYGNVCRHAYQAGDLPYHYLNVQDHAQRYFSSDIFIFWGDFTHTRKYWMVERADTRDVSADTKQWEEKQHSADYHAYIFLSSFPKSKLDDAVVFGSTIITNDAEDETDELYYKHYTQFFTDIGKVYFRDALSAAKISPLRKNEATLGCDCALLLEDSDLEQISGFKRAPERKGVGVFYGRSPSKIKMMLFARLVGKHLGERCSWISWLPWHSHRRMHRWPYMILGYKIRSGDADTGLLLSSLSGYKFIITDTYHLCVNAWRMGIPAICIGEGAGKISTSLNDKKKEMLYEMYGARQFYVFVESLRSFRTFFTESKRIAKVLEGKIATQILANISSHRSMSQLRLSAAIRKNYDKA